MPVSRRARAVLPAALVATAVIAAPASAGTLAVATPCVVDYQASGLKTLKIVGSGFTPGKVVEIQSATSSKPTPTLADSAIADAAGNVLIERGPLSFDPFDASEQSYTLTATDTGNPANATAPVSFTQVRFGFNANPARARPSSKVTYTARGFLPGKPVYAHFRFRGKTKRNVRIGVPSSPCGIVSKRMRLLPTKTHFGTWTVYIDHVRTYSPQTAKVNPLLSARGGLQITRTFR